MMTAVAAYHAAAAGANGCAMSGDEARDFFADLRWGSKTHQTCPHCGCVDTHRYVRGQKRWRCRGCYPAFSVTSETVFNGHKLPLQTILAAIVLYVNAVKGISALQLSRDLNVQYKTAYVLLHKLRVECYMIATPGMSRKCSKLSPNVPGYAF